MGAIIITALAALLAILNVISVWMYLIVAFASGIWMFIGAGLYFKFGFLKFFYHDLLKWHMPDESSDCWNDGCSDHATCRHCGKEIMQDSQGNWFTCKED